MLPSFVPGSVKTVVTLSSPHSMPALVDAWLGSQVDGMNAFWRGGMMPVSGRDVEGAKEALGGVSMLSIATGRRDLLVPTDTCDVSSFCPPDRCPPGQTSTMCLSVRKRGSCCSCGSLVTLPCLARRPAQVHVRVVDMHGRGIPERGPPGVCVVQPACDAGRVCTALKYARGSFSWSGSVQELLARAPSPRSHLIHAAAAASLCLELPPGLSPPRLRDLSLLSWLAVLEGVFDHTK